MLSFAFELVKFDHVKIRIVKLFPQAYKFYVSFSSQPFFYGIGRCFRIFISCNICKRKIIVFICMNFLF